MSDEFDEEFEGDQVLWSRLVVRGLEGGLRESAAANEMRMFRKGERITLAIDVDVDYVAFPGHIPLDAEDDEDGVDRLHITRLVTLAFVDRAKVAPEMDAQEARNAERRSERQAAAERVKEARREARKAEREAAKARTPQLFGDGDGDDGEPLRRQAMTLACTDYLAGKAPTTAPAGWEPSALPPVALEAA